MLCLREKQIALNKDTARKNKKYILKKLEEYYEFVDFKKGINAKEQAIFTFWLAKKQGKLDSLNRIVKNVN